MSAHLCSHKNSTQPVTASNLFSYYYH